MKKVTINDKWQLSVSWVGSLSENKSEKILDLKAACEAEILRLAPTYKQLNAANGLLSPGEAQALLAHIQACRTACNSLEAQIAQATTFEELDTLPSFQSLKESVNV